MNTILTVECVKPLGAPFAGLYGQPVEVELASNEVSHDGWLYRLLPLPGSSMSYWLDSDGTDSLIEELFLCGIESLHYQMQSAIQDKKYAHSEHEAHYIVHLLVSERYYSDESDDFTIVGVLDLNAMMAK